MKKKLSSFSVIVVFICCGIVGAALLPFLSIQLNPSRPSSNLNISFSWRDASAKVIEHEVTSKLEGVVNEVKGIQSINSFSGNERGNVQVDFKEGVDMDAIRFEITNIIRKLFYKLPDGVSYPNISTSSPSISNERLLSYSINADKSPYYIDKYIRKHLLPKLSNIEGVAKVELYGASPYEWVIMYNSNQLIQHQLSSGDLLDAINSYFQKREIGIGNIFKPTGNQQISLILVNKPEEELEWETIPVKKVGERILLLKDLATVQFKERPVDSYHRINGLNSVNLVIFAEKGGNIIRIASEVKKKMEARKNEIPKEYQIKKTSDASEYLLDELQKIKNRTLISLVILLLLTIFIYRNLRYISILFFCILLNLLLAAIFYFFLEIELQLYSFAGVTVSFGIIIDNTIIMMDHLRNKGNKKAFLAILASTLTTIAAVSIIFFLEETQKKNLLDFAYVIIINLGVSLIVALYFVPALMEKFKLSRQSHRFTIKRKRRNVIFIQSYSNIIDRFKKPSFQWLLIIIFVLGFGLPIHMLPQKIENSESFLAQIYNKTIGNEVFSSDYRPLIEKVLGGSFRLFSQDIFSTSYHAEGGQTILTLRGTTPEGVSIEQLNAAVVKMENYLLTFDKIEWFETQVGQGYSTTNVYFKKENEVSSFPYMLKSLVEAKAISLGGMDWQIHGVGRGFSNSLNDNGGNNRITLEGYNYDNLYRYAQNFQKEIVKESRGRVKKVEITSGGYGNSARNEFNLVFNPELLALNNISVSQLYSAIKVYTHSSSVRHIVYDDELQEIKLTSDQSEKFNKWDLENIPITINSNQYKLKQLGSIIKMKTGNDIAKNNQQYHLELKFDFLGPYEFADEFKEKFIVKHQDTLPMGYKIFSTQYNYWDRESSRQYNYILIVIIAIFFICAILLESLTQPLAIISMIPISYIGAFLTFYILEINFDQGGYASFILLSGLSVNAALFIINEFNNLMFEHPNGSPQKLFFKAFNNKIIPILITIITTVVGLFPFIFFGEREIFWYAFAVGSIGGLLFSIFGLFIYLPLFTLKARKNI